jgi:hypothetical protein
MLQKFIGSESKIKFEVIRNLQDFSKSSKNIPNYFEIIFVNFIASLKNWNEKGQR